MNDNSPTEPDAPSDDVADARIETKITTGGTDESRPSPAGAALPFRLLYVSNLTPQSSPSDWSEEDRRLELGPKTAADLQAELGPELTLEIPNRLSDLPETWTVSLSFPTLEAFSPRQIAQQMEPTDRLLDARSLVQAVRDETMDAAAFRENLFDLDLTIDWIDDLYHLLAGGETTKGNPPEESSPSTETERDDALGRVMDMVNTDGQHGARGSESPDPVGADSNSIRAEAAASRILDRLDEQIAAQVEAVRTHPEVRQLEAAWRGLHFLERQIDLGDDVDLLVLPANRDELHEALHHQVLLPEHDETNDAPPISLVMVDQAFGHSHVDVEQLADLAGTGESLQTPVVASVDADFFDLEHVRGLNRLPSLRPHLQGDEYVEWERLRSDNSASFLSLTLPSVQLRPPMEDDSSEPVPHIEEDEGLFGSGALAVGVAAARSYADTGWPTHITELRIDDEALAKSNAGASVSASFSGSMQSELARAGFTVVDADDDRIRIVHAPSVHEPTVYDDPSSAAEARTKASLPCRLFASRVAHRLFTLKRELDLTAPLDELQATVTAEMETFLNVASAPPRNSQNGNAKNTADSDTASDSNDPERIVRVEHVSDVDVPNQEVLAVRLRPPDRILSADARLATVLRVPANA